MSGIPEDVRQKIGESLENAAITVLYKNWRGETAERKIIPLEVLFDKTEYHPEKQWLLRVYDLDKNDCRDYALRDIQKWTSFPH